MMANQNRSGQNSSASCCQVPWLRRRTELENMPMAQINAQASEDDGEDSSGDILTQLLVTQNRLLCDILVTMETLTAQLANRQN